MIDRRNFLVCTWSALLAACQSVPPAPQQLVTPEQALYLKSRERMLQKFGRPGYELVVDAMQGQEFLGVEFIPENAKYSSYRSGVQRLQNRSKSVSSQPVPERVRVLWRDSSEWVQRSSEREPVRHAGKIIGDELITAPLTGTILPGITRDSVIQLAKSWGVKVAERRLSMDEVMAAMADGTLQEAFASGTAAIVSPVGQLFYRGKEHRIGTGKTGPLTERLYQEILQIQYGLKDDPFGWRVRIDG